MMLEFLCPQFLSSLFFLSLFLSANINAPYQATGFKVGEVTDSSAIIWTRLTLRAAANPSDGPMVQIMYDDITPPSGRSRMLGVVYPPGIGVSDIRDAVPGMNGEVRIVYRAEASSNWSQTRWRHVEAKQDYTRQFRIGGLKANTRYEIRVESRDTTGAPGQSLEGGFRTAPSSHDPARVLFTVITGQQFEDRDRADGFNIYPEMLKLQPDFFVHTGDIVYYDDLAKTLELARYHWWRTNGLPTNVEFHRHVSSYFEKDDHDTWQDDCWPTMKSNLMYEFTFEQGQSVFLEQVPMSKRTYRTYRWGKDLQIWLVEGRDFRSPNNAPDGPNKTIWGEKQKDWFKRTISASDATFRILISPTPIVGPDREDKKDNLSNKAFAHEGDELRHFIAAQKNLVVICGDRHWQYMSVDPKTKVREYSCGPASDRHAAGWLQSDFRKDYHRYLNVIGGFLSGTVERVGGKPTLTFRYHDVNGNVRFTDALTAE